MNVSRPVRRFKSLLTSLNGDGRYGLALLVVCALLFLPELLGDAGRTALRYERVAVGAGEWWRLLTAHFVHLDLRHVTLNALGLIMMWALFARDYTPRQWLGILGITIAAIDTGLWLRDTGVEWYVGASGALHGVMAAGTVAHLRRRDLDGWVLAAFMIGKLIYEQSTGALPFSESAAPVVVNSHLYGALGGLAAALALAGLDRQGQRTEPL
jgi:rhomboid family GlyGly-CTERM serine protease